MPFGTLKHQTMVCVRWGKKRSEQTEGGDSRSRKYIHVSSAPCVPNVPHVQCERLEEVDKVFGQESVSNHPLVKAGKETDGYNPTHATSHNHHYRPRSSPSFPRQEEAVQFAATPPKTVTRSIFISRYTGIVLFTLSIG